MSQSIELMFLAAQSPQEKGNNLHTYYHHFSWLLVQGAASFSSLSAFGNKKFFRTSI